MLFGINVFLHVDCLLICHNRLPEKNVYKQMRQDDLCPANLVFSQVHELEQERINFLPIFAHKLGQKLNTYFQPAKINPNILILPFFEAKPIVLLHDDK